MVEELYRSHFLCVTPYRPPYMVQVTTTPMSPLNLPVCSATINRMAAVRLTRVANDVKMLVSLAATELLQLLILQLVFIYGKPSNLILVVGAYCLYWSTPPV